MGEHEANSPPRTYVWNGSAWKEQNGTDSMRDDISTLTTRASELKTSLDGLTSTVSVITQEVDNNTGKITTLSSKVSTLEQTAESIEARVEDNEGAISSLTVSLNSLTSRVSTAEGNISTLTQRANSIEAEVEGKVDEAYGSSSSSFGWSLKTTGFYVYSNKSTVVSITSSGLKVTGDITAKSGSLENMTIAGYLYFGGNKSYYISANNNNSNYYIYLPGFNVNNTTATFSRKLFAPSGTIGGLR